MGNLDQGDKLPHI